MKRVVIHSDARAELDAAMEFYERRATGLGLAFQREVKNATLRIQQNPEAWPLHKAVSEKFSPIVFHLRPSIWNCRILSGSRQLHIEGGVLITGKGVNWRVKLRDCPPRPCEWLSRALQSISRVRQPISRARKSPPSRVQPLERAGQTPPGHVQPISRARQRAKRAVQPLSRARQSSKNPCNRPPDHVRSPKSWCNHLPDRVSGRKIV